MIKILLLFITLFFSFNLSVDAVLCDNEYITRLKDLAEQVEINYEYIDDSIDNRYYITVYLVNEELCIKHEGNIYYYNTFNKGRIGFTVDSGELRFSILSSVCDNFMLKSFSYSLPKFNVYSKMEICQSLKDKNIDICDPWYQGYLDYDMFQKKITKYIPNIQFEKKDNKPLIYIIFACCLIAGLLFFIGSFFIYKRRRSVLE